MALAFFLGDAGIVADMLPGAGYGIKQRRLAAIRVAGQGE
jgi:hypothetical protein